MLVDDPVRLIAAAVVVGVYLAWCGTVYLVQRRKRVEAAGELAALTLAGGGAGARRWLIAFASQTGTAQGLAWQTARSLRAAGHASRVVAMSELAADDLRQAQSALFLVSTYGEGDPPDNAALFARRLMGAPLPLRELRYAVLALGDRAYANFRGFGLALEQWLDNQGARPLFERIDVDKSDEAALRQWTRRLGGIGGADIPDWQAPAFVDWRLRSRRLMNPGSAGGPIYHVELVWPAAGGTPAWEAGDLLQVLVPDDTARPREYSIASLPGAGAVHLLVRQERGADGTLGSASGLLTQEAQPGAVVRARLRPHPNFHLRENADRPLILMGNGTGLAGLLGLLRAREAAGRKGNWLLYGERNAATDHYYREAIERWVANGLIERLDLVFSRDHADRRYVQHRLLEAADTVRDWVQAGAAVYVCGSAQGMAGGVDEALATILTRAGTDRLLAQGRYRRDVY